MNALYRALGWEIMKLLTSTQTWDLPAITFNTEVRDDYFVTALLLRSNLECQYLIKLPDKKNISVFLQTI